LDLQRRRNVPHTWTALEAVDPVLLMSARLSLHYAAQIPGAYGNSLVPPEPDDGHTALVWSPDARLLSTGCSASGHRLGLRASTMALVLLDADGRQLRHISVVGRTLSEAYAWLDDALLEAGAATAEILARGYDLPAHPLARGAAFEAIDERALVQVERWFENAATVLSGFGRQRTGVSAVRCWPHHFDLAVLVKLDDDPDHENAPSVGVGFSPGDPTYPEPYIYVTPWPYPQNPEVAEPAGGGHWHREDWFGAVLPWSQITRSPDGLQQGGRVREFIESAFAMASELI
jgi:hypothetical protein